jgi:hypothetical protein
MQTSDEQFQELMAHLVARGNKALAQGVPVPPMSFALMGDGEVHCSVGVADSPDELQRVLNAMQESLKERVASENCLATCVSYTEPASGDLVVLLENHENYCATVTMPASPGGQLDMEQMQIDDGHVHVFPVATDS